MQDIIASVAKPYKFDCLTTSFRLCIFLVVTHGLEKPCLVHYAFAWANFEEELLATTCLNIIYAVCVWSKNLM